MGNIARFRSNWCSLTVCRSCGHSGSRATMRPLSKHAIIAASLGLAALTVWAQQQDAIFRSDTRLVVCHTTVVDKSGHLVTTLGQEAFTVFENGVQQPIKVFRREDVPVSLGLIIDNSGS